MRYLLVSIAISAMLSLCCGSPIRSRQLYRSEKLQTSKLDPVLSERKIQYDNETLFEDSESIPKPEQGKQDKDKETYVVLVVTVPQTTTTRSLQVVEPEVSPLLLKETEAISPVLVVKDEETPKTETPAPERSPAPSLINAIGNVLVHTIRGNFSGIVDESFGSGVSAPLVTVLNNLLSDTSCNTIRRLLGQCRSPGSEPVTESQRALLLSVVI